MIRPNPAILALCALFAVASASLSFAQTNDKTEISTLENADQPQATAQTQTPPPNNSQAPSLEDLGLTPSQTQSDPQLQARLDKRAHMLKIHQRLGLITAIPMIASVATGFGAGGKGTRTSDRWAHLALGSVFSPLLF